MNIELPAEHPLAEAIFNSGVERGETWLVLKKVGHPAVFRANIKSCSRYKSGVVSVEFETWDEYAERQATGMGL
ncbi:hypotheical protein [Mycobacterium phage PP]|uniref:Hypotheical protein n=1 Tax=Mycobacterium phage PP TaxID=2077134 RepID=A0A2Z5XVG4_9CAUD|nr:hypothetical protein KIW36_gp48 [Mycobacterium phage PP]BBC53843.1 hypotheical protein [Mycobacterium phage PP]